MEEGGKGRGIEGDSDTIPIGLSARMDSIQSTQQINTPMSFTHARALLATENKGKEMGGQEQER